MGGPISDLSRVVTHVLVLVGLGVTLVLSGCALPHDISRGIAWKQTRLDDSNLKDEVRRCTKDLAVIDDAIARAGTGDAQVAAIPGFPHLRTTRFLAALGPRINENDDLAFEYWISLLAKMAIKARAYELANMPQPARVTLHNHLESSAAAVIKECTAILRNFDRRHRKARNVLAATVNVSDDYIDFNRAIGIYPLSSIPVLMGVNRWKERNLPSFNRRPGNRQTRGPVSYYAPPTEPKLNSPKLVAAFLQQLAANPLKLPLPDDDELRQLAAAFAPVFAVEVTGTYDHIGVPKLEADNTPSLDTSSPIVYVQPSWTIFNGVPLLQISYLVWFSERPPSSSMDFLSGRLDGLIWRVTVDADGRALIYDSIHPCGCYHLFFPVLPTMLKDQANDEFDEGTLVPTNAPVLGPKQRMVLHISSRDHYLRGLSAMQSDGLSSTRYSYAAMDSLRSLPRPGGGLASLYDPQGLVMGTERGERFFLWPMGIPNPGAMRQWGTHATAFVGRRHFDDPFLIDRAFFR